MRVIAVFVAFAIAALSLTGCTTTSEPVPKDTVYTAGDLYAIVRVVDRSFGGHGYLQDDTAFRRIFSYKTPAGFINGIMSGGGVDLTPTRCDQVQKNSFSLSPSSEATIKGGVFSSFSKNLLGIDVVAISGKALPSDLKAQVFSQTKALLSRCALMTLRFSPKVANEVILKQVPIVTNADRAVEFDEKITLAGEGTVSEAHYVEAVDGNLLIFEVAGSNTSAARLSAGIDAVIAAAAARTAKSR